MSSEYKKAGVDINAGDALVEWLKTNQPKRVPHRERLVSGIGGFAALFRAGFPEMKSPCLVTSTDGVGTKIKLAQELQDYASLAQDLVGMCVNDVLCCGAQPLFFLDYYATGRLQLSRAQAFLAGLQDACSRAECALIGGETAEMPGVYSEDDFDVAGFVVGVVDEEKALGPHRVQSGDRLIGVESSGFHSNGYSLLRQVFAADLDQWRSTLLTPTHLYTSLVKSCQKDVKAIAHITGGGLDNLLRVLPDHFTAELEAWPIPEPFLEVKRRAQMSWESLLKTLNCGLGLILVVAPDKQNEVMDSIAQQGFKSFALGSVHPAEQKVWHVKGLT